jgi:teichoic acid transport system permease protein
VTTSIPVAPGGPELTKVGGRPPLGRYLARLWERRHFAVELARSRFRAQNEADRLGIFWTALSPLINALVYGFVFYFLLKSDTRPDNFVPFLLTGIFTFQFFSGCLAGGAKSIIGNMGLVRSLHFPRAVLPISLVLEQLFALIPMMGVLAVLVLAFQEPITWKWLLVPPSLFLFSLFNLGVAFIAARATIHVRDLAQLIPFISRLFFYVSGIFFEVQKTFPDDAPWKQKLLGDILEYNPVHAYISLVRNAIVSVEPGNPPYATTSTWLIATGWGIVLAVAGFLFFWRAEERYGRE